MPTGESRVASLSRLAVMFNVQWLLVLQFAEKPHV